MGASWAALAAFHTRLLPCSPTGICGRSRLAPRVVMPQPADVPATCLAVSGHVGSHLLSTGATVGLIWGRSWHPHPHETPMGWGSGCSWVLPWELQAGIGHTPFPLRSPQICLQVPVIPSLPGPAQMNLAFPTSKPVSRSFLFHVFHDAPCPHTPHSGRVLSVPGRVTAPALLHVTSLRQARLRG